MSAAHDHRAPGRGLATLAGDGRVLDAWFPDRARLTVPAPPRPPSGPTPRATPARAARTTTGAACAMTAGPHRRSRTSTPPPADAPDAYLRLHLLSHRLVRPHGSTSTASSACCPTWPGRASARRPGRAARGAAALRADGVHLGVDGVDKFPRMTDYVVPSGVRIADADRVRLGAHLADGHDRHARGLRELQRRDARRVDGRGAHQRRAWSSATARDIGGGASIMGTLSGGGTRSSRSASAACSAPTPGLGISLGDDCVVEAGLYVTAGTRVALPDGEVVKARELSGADGLLFRRNSQTRRRRGDAALGRVGRPQRGAARQRLMRSRRARAHSASVGTSASRGVARAGLAEVRARGEHDALLEQRRGAPPAGRRRARGRTSRRRRRGAARRASSAGSSTSRLAR